MRSSFFLCLFFLFAVGVMLAGCGSTTSTPADNNGEADSTTGFQVSGTLSSLDVSSSIGSKAASTDTITDVMAVSPESGNITCKTATVDSNERTFNFRLTSGRPWYVYFFNRFRTGSSMFMGRFRTSSMDTLTPTSQTGSTDLQTITIDGDTQVATSSREHANIVSDLGLDSDTADAIADKDDIARRYGNPDSDGDGEIDCSNSTNYILDFHVRFNMREGGSQATIADILGDYLSESTTTFGYESTGIYVAYPTTFSSATTGSVTFTDSSVTTGEGGAITAGTATSDVTTNNFTGYNGFGVNTTSASELPSGEIIFSFGEKTLTFSDVQTPSLATITASTGRIFPFIKFDLVDSECASACEISGISYKWLKKTSTGWTSATLTELSLLAADDGGYISVKVDNNISKYVGFAIPISSLTGTLNWDLDTATLNEVTEEQFNALTSDDICNLGLSYDDKLGMRIFQNISDAPGTCE